MSKKTLIVGLTGGIGSGKTAASDYFKTLGICIVDADIVARDVVETGSETLLNIEQHFGPSVILDDGSLNRAWLRQKIFENPEERHWLESVTHPAIRARIVSLLEQASSPYSILVSPLLFESGQDELTDRTLLIDVPESVQLERTAKRDNNSTEQVDAIIKAQMPRRERQQRADDIILNDATLEQLQQKCLEYHQYYLKSANDQE